MTSFIRALAGGSEYPVALLMITLPWEKRMNSNGPGTGSLTRLWGPMSSMRALAIWHHPGLSSESSASQNLNIGAREREGGASRLSPSRRLCHLDFQLHCPVRQESLSFGRRAKRVRACKRIGWRVSAKEPTWNLQSESRRQAAALTIFSEVPPMRWGLH